MKEEYWYCEHGRPWGAFCRHCPGGIGTRDHSDRPRRNELRWPVIGNFALLGVIVWALVEAF